MWETYKTKEETNKKEERNDRKTTRDLDAESESETYTYDNVVIKTAKRI